MKKHLLFLFLSLIFCNLQSKAQTTNCNISVNIIGSATLCAGSSEILIADDGFTSYEWNNGETGNSITIGEPSEFCVTVTDANGCTASNCLDVLASDPINLTITGSTSLCPGNTGLLVAEDGFSSYLWSGGETGNNIIVGEPSEYCVTVTDANACSAFTCLEVLASPPLEVEILSSSNLCNNQSATLSTSSSYDTYLWSNGESTESITVTSKGTYSITVTLNGCEATSSITIDSTFINAQIGFVFSNCGLLANVDLTVDDNAQFLTYNWSNGTADEDLFFVEPGFYSVTISDGNSCSRIAEIDIPSAPPIVISLSVINATCNGENNGVINTSFEGIIPDSYLWSTGSVDVNLSGVGAGNYSLTITDIYGCTYDAGSASVSEPAVLNVSGNVTPNTSCDGICNGSIELTVSGGTPSYTFNWGINGSNQNLGSLCQGTYTVTVEDVNACITNLTFTINDESDCSDPCANFSASAGADGTTCDGIGYQLQATGGSTYSWLPIEGLSDATIANPVATPTVTTTYTVSVTSVSATNLVTNGGFESGNTDFSTDYIYVSTPFGAGGYNAGSGLYPEGRYSVGNSANFFHPSFTGAPNTGSNFLIVNGQTNTGPFVTYDGVNNAVWSQSVPVVNGTEYNFSAYISAVYPTSVAKLEVTIDGNPILTNQSPSASAGTWTKISANYTATSTANVKIRIVDNNLIAFGNDFGIDDISLNPICKGTDKVVVNLCAPPPPDPCANFSASAGADGETCGGVGYQLNASGGTSYSWAPAAGLSATNIANPIAAPASTTTYTVTVTNITSSNLVLNGDFEAGNTNITSDYTYVADVAGNTELLPPSLYSISNNAANVHPQWNGLGNSGNFMIVNGFTDVEKTVWAQSVPVVAGQQYNFSAYVSAIFSASLAQLEFSIDNVIVSPNFSPSLPVGTWTKFNTNWTASSTGNVDIKIIDNNTQFTGNDYGIDDISFSAVCTGTATVKVNVCSTPPPPPPAIPCAQREFTASASCFDGTSSSITTTTGFDAYVWDANAALSKTNISNPTVTAPGTYCVTAKAYGAEIIRNGDFSLGDDQTPLNVFTTDYISVTGSPYVGTPASGLYPEGRYAVDGATNNVTSFYHPIFYGLDNTSGSGNYLIVNGQTNVGPYATYDGVNTKVWQQAVSVIGGQAYKFSLWEKNLNDHSNATLRVSIGSTILSSSISNPVASNTVNNTEWAQYTFDYVAASSGVVNITITDLSLIQDGNDFGIDDISFKPVCSYKACVTVVPCAVPPCVDPANAGDDVTYCGDTVQIGSAANPAYLYNWKPTASLSDPNISNPFASPGVTTTYSLTVSKPLGPNVVVNGDFETPAGAGQIDPSITAYGYVANVAGNTELIEENLYGIGGNAANYHPAFSGTSHAGANFMIVNGYKNTPGFKVWEQTVTVTPNTTYNFSCWITAISQISTQITPIDRRSHLKFQVDGADLVGLTDITPNSTVGSWSQLFDIWTSGATQTSATISIVETFAVEDGNDFGLDDIQFFPACVSTDKVVVSTCNSDARNDESIVSSISAYPNPVADNLTLEFNASGNTTIRVMNALGQLVYTESFDSQSIEKMNKNINTSNFASGMYLVSIVSDYGVQTTGVVKK